MVRIGIVGFGFMGKMHFNCLKKIDAARIVAICDADEKRLKDPSGIAGNIAGADSSLDLSGIELYNDFDRMLNEAKLDAVSITLPTFLHADFSCKALEAGLHVLCEKPMGLNSAECDRMIESAEKHGKILQIGHCIRFWPEYIKTKELIDSGTYGNVLAISFRRLTAAPKWSSENWLLNEKRSGGVELDLHIHDTDFVQYLFGMPKEICSFGSHRPEGGLAHIVSHFIYEDNKVVSAEAGWVMKPSFGFEMSFVAVLEKTDIIFDCTRTPAFRVCPDEGDAFTPEVVEGDGYSRQLEHFIQRIQQGVSSDIVPLESSRNSIRLVEAQKESIRTNQRVILR